MIIFQKHRVRQETQREEEAEGAILHKEDWDEADGEGAGEQLATARVHKNINRKKTNKRRCLLRIHAN